MIFFYICGAWLSNEKLTFNIVTTIDKINKMKNDMPEDEPELLMYIQEKKYEDRNYTSISSSLIVYYIEAHDVVLKRSEKPKEFRNENQFYRSNLLHKNISQSYIRFAEQIEAKWVEWSIMEFLDEIIAEKYVLNEQEIMKICLDLLKGVCFMHINHTMYPNFDASNILGTRKKCKDSQQICDLALNIIPKLVEHKIGEENRFIFLYIFNVEVCIDRIALPIENNIYNYVVNATQKYYDKNSKYFSVIPKDINFGNVQNIFDLKITVSKNIEKDNVYPFILLILIETKDMYKIWEKKLENDIVIKPIIYKEIVEQLLDLSSLTEKEKNIFYGGRALIEEINEKNNSIKDMLNLNFVKTIINAKSIINKKILKKLLLDAELVFKLHNFQNFKYLRKDLNAVYYKEKIKGLVKHKELNLSYNQGKHDIAKIGILAFNIFCNGKSDFEKIYTKTGEKSFKKIKYYINKCQRLPDNLKNFIFDCVSWKYNTYKMIEILYDEDKNNPDYILLKIDHEKCRF